MEGELRQYHIDETDTNITHGMVNKRSQHVQQKTEQMVERVST